MTPHDFKMTEGKQESGMRHQAAGDPWPWPTRQTEGEGTGSAIHGIDLPGFDSEAHRAFMRSLG